MHFSQIVEEYQIAFAHKKVTSFTECYKSIQDSKMEIAFDDTLEDWDYFGTRDFTSLPPKDLQAIFDIIIENCTPKHKMWKDIFECTLHHMSESQVKAVCQKFGDVWYKNNYMVLIKSLKESADIIDRLDTENRELKKQIKDTKSTAILKLNEIIDITPK